MSQRNTNSSKNSSTLGYAVTAGLGVLLGYMAHKFLSSEDENRSRTEVAHQHGGSSCHRSVPIQPTDQCLICCEEMKPPMEQLPCEHLFHQNCILTWLDTQGTCPICRLSLNRKQLDAYRGRAVH